MMGAAEHLYHDSYSFLFFLEAVHRSFLKYYPRRLSNSRMSLMGFLQA
jgi:hypothetical protein